MIASVGHLIVDALASRFRIRMDANKCMGGFVGHGHPLFSDRVSLTLFKPSTCISCCSYLRLVTRFASEALMNITGPSVSKALRSTAVYPHSMVIIHDSLDHKTMALSVKFGGSANGHNGVRSVITALGANAGFYRFRIGIGRDRGVDPAEYVLSRLSLEEIGHWGYGGAGLDAVCREVEQILGNLTRGG